MLDYHIMDVAISGGYFFSINENTLTITMYTEDEKLVKSLHNENQLLFSTGKILSFPLGDSLFNFLSISYKDLEVIQAMSNMSQEWDGLHEQNETSLFLASFDCMYLYLLFYSFDKNRLGLEYKSRLDRLSREFEFVLNFCCNDYFEPKFKSLSSLQRYYLYSQLYPDNIYTIDRHFQRNDFLFIEPKSHLSLLDKVPRMVVETDKYGRTVNELEAVTEKPTLPDELLSLIQDVPILPIFRFKRNSLESYLMEELFSLIKMNVRVKKCLNCGKYFILKGDYATDYCDRIPEGEKHTCKKLAAMQTRKKKVSLNPILKEYERAYKRNYSRVSNKRMTNEDFRKWVDAAIIERDRLNSEYNGNPPDTALNEFKKYLGNKLS